MLVSSIIRLKKTILAHYSRFNKIATLGYIMAHEGMGTDHYSMSRLNTVCVDRIDLLDIVTSFLLTNCSIPHVDEL